MNPTREAGRSRPSPALRPPNGAGRRLSVFLIIVCQIAAMTLWFSVSAAVPSLIQAGALQTDTAAALTAAVQLGFVVGTLLSAATGLADRFDPRWLFALAALLGAGLNALLLATGLDAPAGIALRFGIGVCMAGVYPVGMKLAAGWAAGNMGLLIGTLVGALTLGSAMPHLFNALHSLDWQAPLMLASGCAVASAIAIRFVRLGPRHGGASRFRLTDLRALLRNKPVLLAQGGYLGHMWELYAMWAWLGSFLAWALPASGFSHPLRMADISLATFLVMAVGALGCVIAGAVADRVGRTFTTMVAMLLSGGCAALIGFAVDGGPVLLIVVATLWGLTIVADSAQFSAAVAELADPRFVGTLLTLQTSLGFLLTACAIWLVPQVADNYGWRHAFSVLAIGPFLGVLSMWRLQQQPEAQKMAGGRR